MRHTIAAVSLALALVAALPADWPQWRGPHRDGRVEGFDAPAHWPDQLRKGWSIEVGEGHSSPLAVGDTVFQLSRQGEEEVIRALTLADGRVLWRVAYPAPYTMNPAARGHGKGPKSTPAYAAGKLYTLGISGILSCFDASSGKLVWRKDFTGQFSATSPLYGAGMSPAVVDGRVLVHIGGPGSGALLALDADSGEPIWQWTEDGPGYASPIVATLDGARQVLTQTEKFVVGVDFATGHTLWKIPFSTAYDQNSLTPVLLDDLLIYSGTRQPTVAVRIGHSGGKWTTEKVWSNPEIPMYMSTPALHGDLLFGLTQNDKGALFCADARTGKLLWKGSPRQGDNASLLVSGDLLLALTTEAELIVAKASGADLSVIQTYEVAASNVWAHPALIGPYILIKDATTLTRWSVE
ncbi:MAG: PQQ-binding-like beta-propeller repeat protein [Acidobacteria bacterium]|nr:PQQ-binding-like beta-propeller repeat protein [Acidobacteriota bacterium]